MLAAACWFRLKFGRKPTAIQSARHTIAKGNLGEQNSPRLTIYLKVSSRTSLRDHTRTALDRRPVTDRFSPVPPLGVILSIDGRGTVTFHHPEKSGR
jgi:hypothetical protein